MSRRLRLPTAHKDPSLAESTESLDARDREILRLLGEDARQSPAEVAKQTGMSAAAIRRRIARMERLGVIIGYTIVVAHHLVEPSIEAYVELDFKPDANVPAFVETIVARSEIREASTLAGHPDAIVRLRIASVDDLRRIVTELRETGEIIGSKTLVALGRERHVSKSRKNRPHGPDAQR
jgi:Lrp/AsnC family transcriptional regulator, leucine-responsive regulatory protein